MKTEAERAIRKAKGRAKKLAYLKRRDERQKRLRTKLEMEGKILTRKQLADEDYRELRFDEAIREA